MATSPTVEVDGIFVTAHSSQINNNNVENKSPYHVTELDGGCLKEKKASGTECTECGREFPSFSALMKHNGKKCEPFTAEEEAAAMADQVLVTFPSSLLPLCETFLISIGKDVVLSADGLTASVAHARTTYPFFLERLYYAQCSAFNLEQWYPAVEALAKEAPDVALVTAKTNVYPLTDEDLDTIRMLYGRGEMKNSMSREENARAASLEHKMQRLLAEMGDGPFFVRLSSRSPKDSHVKDEKRDSDACAGDVAQGDAAAAKLQQKKKGLQVVNGRECLRLLSTSMRICSDINSFFKYRTPNCPGESLNLIVREWVDMPNAMEFRCFVRNRVVTAISQYHCYDVFTSLQNEDFVRRISAAIVACNDRLKGCFPVPDYVLDVCYINGEVYLVELNPFGSHLSSGAALFNWEADRAVMYGEMAPPGGFPAVRVLRELTGTSDTVRVAPSALFRL